MNSDQSGIEQRIAAHLKERRLANGLSLADLAERSGVSRAMISKVERSAASPTAALLGRLCNGLGVTLSSLIANAEQTPSPLVRAKDQTTWQDPVTGLTRTMISPDLADSAVEIVRIDLPPQIFCSIAALLKLRVRLQHVAVNAAALKDRNI